MENGWLVKDVAAVCGVSIRLLHHWDAVGLVTPSKRLPNGYRLYTEPDVKRIQQALLYRETGMRLERIKELLDSEQNEEYHLRMQLQLLEEASIQLERKMQAVHQLLEDCMKGKAWSIEDKANLMGKDWLPEWEAEAQSKWGDTEDWKETQSNLSKMSQQDWRIYRAETQRLEEKMSTLCREGIAPDSDLARTLIEEYRKNCSQYHFEITHAKHVLLGKLYTEDPRFNQYYEKLAPGFAKWVRDAIESNAQKHGIDLERVQWE